VALIICKKFSRSEMDEQSPGLDAARVPVEGSCQIRPDKSGRGVDVGRRGLSDHGC